MPLSSSCVSGHRVSCFSSDLYHVLGEEGIKRLSQRFYDLLYDDATPEHAFFVKQFLHVS